MKIISSELYVKDNKVYHEGNKPKPKDIGAAPETHTHNYASATTPGGSAEHAIKATEDSLGQRIDKYIKGLSVSGRTITYTRGDGTTGTITTQDNNTDTKVTNTLNTTAKAYITGTTDSATNTGTQVFDINVYLDTTAGMLTATTFKGALQGNATTATSATSASHAAKLTTPRSINGTNFDGTAAITTSHWGTARTLTIGNTGKSVNGSGNVSWSIGEIGAAPTVHNHTSLTGITNLSFAAEGTDSASIKTTVEGANTYFDFNLSDDPSQNDMWRWRFAPAGGNIFNAMTLDAISSTEAKLTVAGEVQATRLKGTLTGDVKGNVTGTVSGNAGSATKLATARIINGTSFDGTANITTANWGTARTLTVGSASKSVNGSANVSWSLDEIGARPRIKKVIDLSNTTTYSVDKWYPCLATIPYDGMHDIEVAVQLNSGVKPSWATHDGGFTCNLHVKAIAGGWGTTSANSIVLNHSFGFTSVHPCSYSQLLNSSNAVLWLRGGGKYFVFTDWNASWSVKTASTEISSQTVAPVTSCPSISLTKATMIADLSGNATTATTLQTTRTINGTNFNGSANITTANWGTTRTLTIGNTGKSVNGSGNVSWSLSEIGAAPAGYGLGTTCQDKSNQDCNNILVTGFYMGSNMTNKPSGCTQGWIYLLVMRHNDSWVRQVAYDFGTASQVYTRVKQNGSWTSWVATDTNTWRGVQDNLTSTATDQSLSANQGKVLKGLIDGKAASNHTHSYVPLANGGNITIHADSDSSSTGEYALIKAGHNELKIASSAGGTTVTKGQDKLTFNGNIVYHAGRKPTISEIGAAAASHTHNYAGSSSAGGNANAAVKLATARTINGTNFDGTGNITTANWGTARNITIGNTAKSVNGSGNVAWSLSEIGAAAASHNHDSSYYTKSQAAPSNLSRGLEKTITVNGNANTYYPVTISVNDCNFAAIDFTISRRYNEPAPDTWNTGTHRGGLTFSFRWNGDPYWGGNGSGDYQVLWLSETYCTMVQNIQSSTSGMVVWLRGGGAVYHITSSQGNNFTATVSLTSFTDNANNTFAPTNTVGNRNNIYHRWTGRQSQVFDSGNRVYSPSNAPNLGSIAAGGTFIGEAKFSQDGSWNDPWYGLANALKVSGKASFSDTVRLKDIHVLGHTGSAKTAVISTYTNPDRMEFFWSKTPGGTDWDWSNKCYMDANGVFYAAKQVSIGGHRITPYSGNGVSIIRPDGQEFSGLEVKELWIGPYSGATRRLSMGSNAPSSPSVGDVWIQN